MGNKLCFECGKVADIEHHVIPKSKGGTKTIPLCNDCHSIVHDAKLISSSALIKNGRQKSRELRNNIVDSYKSGASKLSISKKMQVSRKTVYNVLKENKLYEDKGIGLIEKVSPELIEKIKILRDRGKTWEQIEKETGVSHTHLFRIIEKYKLKGKYNSKIMNRTQYQVLTDEKIAKAKELRKKRLTWKQIADILGVTREILYWHNIPQQFEHLRGTLTEKKKELAISLRKEGKTWKEIAEILQVSKGALYWNKIHKLCQ